MSSKKINNRKKVQNKNNSKVKTKNKTSMSTDSKKEVAIIITLGISIIILLSNFGILGKGGNFISGIFFGILGIEAYIFPIVFLIGLFIILFKTNKIAIYKYIAIIMFFISIISIVEVFYIDNLNFVDTFLRSYNKHNGGGILGYIVAYPLTLLLTKVGAFLIILIIFTISLTIILEKVFMLNILRNMATTKEKIIKKEKILEEVNKEKVYTDKKIEEIELKNEDNSWIEDIDNVIKDISSNETLNEDIKDKEDFVSKEKTEVVTKIKEDEKPIIIEPITSIDDDYLDYKFPDVALLDKDESVKVDDSGQIRELAIRLKKTLESFGVDANISDISRGPSVTRFEIVPEIGVKVSKIVGLTDDIKLNLAAKDIRIEAPIPGKAAIGIEVPNEKNNMVHLRTLIESDEFKNAKSKLSFCVGLDISGRPIIADIHSMPHVLVAGATGSGKSVCINTLIMSIIYKSRPDEVKMIMIDPKVVELSIYNGIKHLLIPVVTDPKKAAGALNWAVVEMENRYKKFAKLGVKDLATYNAKVATMCEEGLSKLPKIVIIIDELADLMMVASSEVEASICRLAQLARACGMHLVIATQRPSVNVITGLIKANIPSRIAFAVSSGVDSRTILDMNGAEKLLGKGDMLFHPSSLPKPIRVQGAFISDKEVHRVVDEIAIKENVSDDITKLEEQITSVTNINSEIDDEIDDYFEEAARMIVEKNRASIGLLQRFLRVGFNRASRIMEQLQNAGIVGPDEGTKPRKVLVDEIELENILKKGE